MWAVVAQMALRHLGNVVDEVGLHAERRGETQHGVQLGVVDRAVDKGHDRCKPNRFGSEIGLGRQRRELVGPWRRQARKVGR
jgi:hypothetical protein